MLDVDTNTPSTDKTELSVAIADILRRLTEDASFAEVVAGLTGQLGKWIAFDQAAVWAISDNKVDVHLLFVEGNPDPVVSPIAFNLAHERSPFRTIAETGLPLLMGDVTADERYEWNRYASQYRTWVGVPLTSRKTVRGFLCLASNQPNAFDPSHIDSMLRAASAIALCVDFLRLAEEAEKREHAWDRLLGGVPASVRELRNATREDYVEDAMQTLASALYTTDLIGLLLRSEEHLKAFKEIERLHEALRICLTVLQKQL